MRTGHGWTHERGERAVLELRPVCENCGGGFQPRPVRPAREWRPGVSRVTRPPATERKVKPVDPQAHQVFAEPVCAIAPAQR